MTAVILASGSATRHRLLTEAGLSFTVQVDPVDEVSLRDRSRAMGHSSADTATALADAKAAVVAAQRVDALVIGADQILERDDAWLDKPADHTRARWQLQSLRGRSHRLFSAVSVWRGDQRLWTTVDVAELEMRAFSDDFLEHYLEQAGDAVTSSVGAYQLEGLGAQLFTSVRGDFFTVLGLPLLPLLGFLRDEGVLRS